MRIYIKLMNGIIETLQYETVNIFKNQNIIHFSLKDKVDMQTDIDSFCKRNNGITLVEHMDSIQIYNDPFRTMPLYYTNDNKGGIYFFTNFQDYYNMNILEDDLDEVGLWETILLGQPLYTRTLYKNVNQMIGASVITLKKKNNEITLDRYWDYNINEESSINSIDQAGKGLYDVLDNIFNDLNKEKNYLLGLSGGLDSRITLAFLSKYLEKGKLDLFTYGYNEKILEYQYAKEVAHKFNYKQPKFHTLDENSYKNAINYLPKMSGGQIGINHCHILDYLINSDQTLNDTKMISTYYSDAAFGYETKMEKSSDTIEDLSVYKNILNQPLLKDNIREEIINDINSVISGYKKHSNYSSIDEYWYVTERNTKFHMNLAHLQSEYLPTVTPFANFELLNYMISLPLKYRYEKRLVDFILKKYFGYTDSNQKNVSSRLWKPDGWKKDLSVKSTYYEFKALNYINAFFMMSTGGRVQMLNKYQTENQNVIIRKHLRRYLDSSLSNLEKLNYITKKQRLELSNIPLRASKVGISFNLISVGEILNYSHRK